MLQQPLQHDVLHEAAAHGLVHRLIDPLDLRELLARQLSSTHPPRVHTGRGSLCLDAILVRLPAGASTVTDSGD